MKFYKPCLDDFDAPHKIYADMKESEKGEYATRADAEQAATDAVAAAKQLQQEIIRWKSQAEDWNAQEDRGMQYARAIIERYEGGQQP